MALMRATTKPLSLAVTFPEEKLLVRRPSLKRICQDNTDLAELLSYFIYEVSKDATIQGIDPKLVCAATLYRTQEEILYGIDYSTTQKVMRQNIVKLEQLGLLQSCMHEHAYTVLVESIRQALVQRSQARKKPQVKLKLPPSEIHLTEPLCRDIQPCHLANRGNLPDDTVNLPDDVVVLPDNVVNLPRQSGNFTTFDIGGEMAPQAALLPREDASRYSRYNREIKRDNRDDVADATTPFSSFSVSQSSPSLQESDGEPARQKSMVANEQNKYDRRWMAINENENAIKKLGDGTPPTVEAFLALADYYRGYRLTHSSKQNSPYLLALEAATTFVNRKKTLAEIDAVFAYMKGIDERFCDDWWPMHTVDIWHVMRHFDSMVHKMTHRRAYAPGLRGRDQTNPGFPINQIAEIMEMPLAERKLYLARQREQMQQPGNIQR